MKRLLSVGCLLLLSVFALYAQNGYKEYRWGITENQVKAMSTGMEFDAQSYVSWNTPRNTLRFLRNSELRSRILSEAPDPLWFGSGNITQLIAVGNDLEFFFLDNKLIAVELKFIRMNVISDLQRQYGSVNFISWLNGGVKTASWDREENRIVSWLSSDDYMEWVTYIDKNWLMPLINKAMDEYRKEQSDARSRLD